MNRIAVSIKNRLSLRPPQAESLDILAELAGQLFWFPRSAWERESICMGTKNRIEKWIRRCRIDLSCSHAPRGSTFPDAQRQELWM
ncbi:MAG: hypothetical protein C4518_00070 [Desulfobacteraceae bacterium]|nr:MAG: hypothetical protein C4518_00070 [Desulfobacteraceae bacterium]